MKHILTILFLFVTNYSFANTIVVGRNKPVSSIKKAVEMAKSGDTILIKKGTYKEGNIIIDKPLSLIGEDDPVLDGEKKTEILTITTSFVVIKGLHLINAGYSSVNEYAAITVENAANVVLENNIILNAYFAIHVADAVDCIIRNNYIKGKPKQEETTGNGIHLWKCDNVLIRENEIQGHRDGIYFEFVTNSLILENYSHQNLRYGIHFMFSNDDSYYSNTFQDNGAGVAVMYSKRVVMQKNTFLHNWGPNAYGLLLKEISDAQIIDNDFNRNTAAIVMESTSRINVFNNRFINSGWAMRIQASCTDNFVYNNDFYANTFDVSTNGTLSLNKFYHNYWDKYEGYDMNKDGVGDVPFHPVSMYSMVVEQSPNAVILMRSFIVSLLDKAEKAIPSLTPENLVDTAPAMKKNYYDQN
ncbi:MAG: nitrous oxide reductase family maturation protein NosD [Flavisolibacter sp.]